MPARRLSQEEIRIAEAGNARETGRHRELTQEMPSLTYGSHRIITDDGYTVLLWEKPPSEKR